MRCWLHKWSKWQDVKLADKIEAAPYMWTPWVRQVIKQQRRCERCSVVETRTE